MRLGVGPLGRLDSMTESLPGDIDAESYTVGTVATQVGVTVRALHHWDTIGLVRPSGRGENGYRRYTATDIARIHRVLVYRELGLALNEIGPLLDASAADALGSLRQQRDQLRHRVVQLSQMEQALDRMIEARQSGILLSAREQIEIFGADWQPSWAEGAEQRWGDTVQWAQFAERAAERTADQWQQITADVDALHAELAAAHRLGVVPGSQRANELAERHRDSIGVYFDCSHSMHVCIGQRCIEDPGFAEFYNSMEPGMAAWLREIIEANARIHGIDPELATWA